MISRWHAHGAQIVNPSLPLRQIAPSNSVRPSYPNSPLSSMFLTGDIQTRQSTTTWTLPSAVPNQQVRNTWVSENTLVSLSLFGDLNVFDPRSGSGPTRVIQAPQKSLTAISLLPSSSETFLAGSADGRVHSYSPVTFESTRVEGNTHSTLVISMAPNPKAGKVHSVGFDDSVREIDVGGFKFTFVPLPFPKLHSSDLGSVVQRQYQQSPNPNLSLSVKTIRVSLLRLDGLRL